MIRVIVTLSVLFCIPLVTSAKPQEKSPGQSDGEKPTSAHTQREEPPPAPMPEKSLTACQDGIDNDLDTHVDCGDQDCEIYAVCVRQTPEPGPASEGDVEKSGEAKVNEARVHRPFSIGVVPGLTTDGGADGKVINNFSLNFIGWGDYLAGADVSWIGGIRKFDAKGFQGAGIFNYTNGEFRGFQAAGITDITRGSLVGFQGSGIASVTTGGLTGFQGAGITSITIGRQKGFQGAGIATVATESMTGFAAAGIANVSIGQTTGFQGAGISNYAGSMRGAQLSGIANITATNFSGLQAGLINYGSVVRGAQIGLINIAAREMRGVSVGLVNFAGNGMLAPVIYGSDTSALNLGLKMGSRYMYSILGWGIHPVPGEERDSLIVGLGGHIDFDPFWLEVDVVTHFLHDEYRWHGDDLDMIHKLRPTVGFRVVDQFSIFAGPTLNLMVTEVSNRESLIPALARYTRGDLSVEMSVGFIAGLQWEPNWGSLNSR